jgi:predicted ArsR family transcriptional regulator
MDLPPAAQPDVLALPLRAELFRALAELRGPGTTQQLAAQAGRLRFVLRNCPYREAVPQNPPVICTLHRGITQGLLDRLGPQATLTGFVARDPQLAGCEIELEP